MEKLVKVGPLAVVLIGNGRGIITHHPVRPADKWENRINWALLEKDVAQVASIKEVSGELLLEMVEMFPKVEVFETLEMKLRVSTRRSYDTDTHIKVCST